MSLSSIGPALRSAVYWVVAAVLLSGGFGVEASERSPLDAEAVVPQLRYESAFEGYRRLQDLQPADWRAANETVGRIGGWRVYSREPDSGAVPQSAQPLTQQAPTQQAPTQQALPAARNAPAAPMAPAAPATGHQHVPRDRGTGR